MTEEKEDFHKFLQGYCDMFTKNVYSAKDYTYSNLKRLFKDDTLVVIPGDKVDCVTKMEEMISKKAVVILLFQNDKLFYFLSHKVSMFAV